MFTDTHCHMSSTQEKGCDMNELIKTIVTTEVPFILDIGTNADDLPKHINFVNNLIAENLTESEKKIAKKIFHFSAGILPNIDDIINRAELVNELEKNIVDYKDSCSFLAIGECGIDHFWNKVDETGKISGFEPQQIFDGEKELFEMQIDLAKKLNVPVIVHSRDAFNDTYDIIKNSGWTKGVIHCFSYGIEEVKKFLDLGWYISLSGTITFAKKSQMDATYELVRAIPIDRLFLETDSPYLTPVPMRGKINNPILVKYVYEFIAGIVGVSKEELAKIVLENTKRLFFS